ncbi:MAG: CPBP family intramembrane glutamic endopeptidase [Candidatus Krumholzibacteriia bacterium]
MTSDRTWAAAVVAPILVILGLAVLHSAPAVFLLAPAMFPAPDTLDKVLSGWGLDSRHPGFTMAFMAIVNGPAEELFWRGWLQDRLLKGWRSGAVLVLLFSSYHVLTVGTLAPGPPGTVIMHIGVMAGAVFWTWSRRRWDSIWPALLSHWGATMGYMLVCARLLAAG